MTVLEVLMATMRRRIFVATVLGAMAGVSRAGMPVPEVTIRDLGSPSCEFLNSSYAWGINNRGQVVGESGCGGFLWQDGTFTDLGVLPGGYLARPFDVNDRGQIVGLAFVSGGHAHAFRWEDGVMIDLGARPDLRVGSEANAINGHGDIVGTAYVEGYPSHTAALWKDGDFVNLGTLPGGSASVATDINERGQVVGGSGVGPLAPCGQHAFLWDDGKYIDLGAPPDLPCTGAYGINNHGQVVGVARGDYGYRAVVWQHGTMTLLEGLPGSSGSCGAERINDRGQIVGWNFADGGFRAVLWQDEQVIDLGVLPGMDQCEALDINNQGQVVGVCYSDFASRAVLWEVR